MNKAIIFDLDNTLYDPKQYFFGAFKEIAMYLSKKYNISKEEIYVKLKNIWKEKTSMYPYLFNDLLNLLDLKKELNNILKIFNNYEGVLQPYPDVINVLNRLKEKGYLLGIITDGTIERQKRKISLLGLDNFFDTIIFTKQLNNPKPSKIPFEYAIEKLNVNSECTYYVGDNPLIDFKGAKKTGMKTIRVSKGEFRNIPKNKYIDHEIKELEELLGVINNG